MDKKYNGSSVIYSTKTFDFVICLSWYLVLWPGSCSKLSCLKRFEVPPFWKICAPSMWKSVQRACTKRGFTKNCSGKSFISRGDLNILKKRLLFCSKSNLNFKFFCLVLIYLMEAGECQPYFLFKSKFRCKFLISLTRILYSKSKILISILNLDFNINSLIQYQISIS